MSSSDLTSENARLRRELRLARSEAHIDDKGIERHRCGRPVSECRQRNGKWWCDIVNEPVVNGDGYDG